MIEEIKGKRFEAAQRSLLHQEVISVIFRALIQGRIKPGERLVEDDIAEELGVSRSPIRRALVEMSQMGIVDLIPHKGARIKSWNIDEIIDFWRFRVLIEGLAAEQAAERMTPEEKADLLQITKDLEAAVKEDSLEKITELDLKFHIFIVKSSKNDSVISSYESMILRIHIFMIIEKHFYRSEEAYQTSLNSHWNIYEAIKAGNAELARNMMVHHIEESVEDLLQRMDDYVNGSDREDIPDIVENIFKEAALKVSA